MNEKSKFLLKGVGPLWIASFIGHPNVVETLLSGGANVNQTDKVGNIDSTCVQTK